MESMDDIAAELVDGNYYDWHEIVERVFGVICANPDASIDCFEERLREKLLREFVRASEEVIDETTVFIFIPPMFASEEDRAELEAKHQRESRKRALRHKAGAGEWLRRHRP